MSNVVDVATKQGAIFGELSNLCNLFLDKIGASKTGTEIDEELETRFKDISKINHDNVIKKLLSLGFTRNPATASLNILLNDGIRVPVIGEQNIYQYCNNSQLTDEMYENIERKKRISQLDFSKEKEFPFNFTLSTEDKVNQEEKENIKSRFNSISKTFRYIIRLSFVHENFPYLTIDLSTVIQSKNQTFIQSFANPETYEVEIEFRKDKQYYFYGTEIDKEGLRLTEIVVKNAIIANFKKYIKYVLGGIQESNYPISIKEQEMVLRDYAKVLDVSNDYDLNNRGNRAKSLFIGPSTKTLQVANITKSTDSNVPNLRIPGGFCVTEKADGERHLMFINSVGKIYLITSNMQVKFTGMKCDPEIYKNSIIDGELITHDKRNTFINTYAAFDLYYLRGKDVRFLKFMPIPAALEKNLRKKEEELLKYKNATNTDNNKEDNEVVVKIDENNESWTNKYRLVLLNELMDNIFLPSVVPPVMIFRSKIFYPNIDHAKIVDKEEMRNAYNIFTAAKAILNAEYPYYTDGAIFTPTSLGVGGNSIGNVGPLHRTTWDYSLKWKPPELNTNDFLVKVEQKGGSDIIHNAYQDGTDLKNEVQMLQYKHLQLFCGSKGQNEIFQYPCEKIYNGDVPRYTTVDPRKKYSYQAIPFVPTNPYDATAAFTKIKLTKEGLMMTEDKQVFENDTIVEFRYDLKNGTWIPLRLRYDKTSEYKNKQNQFGNSFETANSNWTSIHHPVTKYMITTGKNNDQSEIEMDQESDLYYKTESGQNTQTRGLRDFHNKYVKQLLIQSVCHPRNTLIDFACGRGGDIQKWREAKLDFVYGLDYSESGLTNSLDGACSRYLNDLKNYPKMPHALFVHADSKKNIISGKAIFGEKGKKINDVVFGEQVNVGTHNASVLGKGVMAQANRGKDGFNVSSCQFAMHYMYESADSFYNFVQNIAECTKYDGYYIATCYDGKQLFDLLKDKNEESIVEKDKLVWQVVKKYNSDIQVFPEGEASLGMEILVYQESFNSWQPEYLVNNNLFDKTMNEYGLYLLTESELKDIQFPLKKSSALFGDLYHQMTQSHNKYGTAAEMKKYEQKISFLNRYFIYKSRNHTKKNFSDITAKHLNKQISTNVEEVNIDKITRPNIDKRYGDAAIEEKEADLECQYDKRLNDVLYKTTKIQSTNVQNKLIHLIKSAVSSSNPSADILHKIDKLLKQNQKNLKNKEDKNKEDKNKDYNSKEYISNQIISYFNRILQHPMLTPQSRLIDIGGGTGDMLRYFAEKYQIPKENVVSIDNGSFAFENKSNLVTYINQPHDDVNSVADLLFNNADYIICSVSLHHMTDVNIQNAAVFIQRHLKPDGFLIIKEHDASTKDVKCLIDWEHHLYRLMETDKIMPLQEVQKYINDEYIGNYKREKYFDDLLEPLGFKLINTYNHVMYDFDASNKWEKNPTQMYWKIYQFIPRF